MQVWNVSYCDVIFIVSGLMDNILQPFQPSDSSKVQRCRILLFMTVVLMGGMELMLKLHRFRERQGKTMTKVEESEETAEHKSVATPVRKLFIVEFPILSFSSLTESWEEVLWAILRQRPYLLPLERLSLERGPKGREGMSLPVAAGSNVSRSFIGAEQIGHRSALMRDAVTKWKLLRRWNSHVGRWWWRDPAPKLYFLHTDVSREYITCNLDTKRSSG